MMRRWCGVAAAVVLAAGCAGHEIDRAGWERDLKAAGVTVTDWDKLERTVLDLCDDDEETLQAFVAVSLKSGTPSMGQMRINFRHACPDQVQQLDDAIAEVGRASGEVDQACRLPASERSERQQQLAEAMNC